MEGAALLMRINLGQMFSCQLAQLVQQNAQLVQHNATFNRVQEHQQNAQLIAIQEQLGQLLIAGGVRRRGSVASLHSIASFAGSIGQRTAWKELSKEFHGNGVTADMIKAKKEEILKLFRTASIHSFSGNPDERARGELQGPEMNSEQGKQNKAIDRRPFDAMMEVLVPPAMQARYFVARLVGGKGALVSSLHIAAANGETSLVNVLLDRGANIKAMTDERWAALHRAANGGHVEVVKVLLDRGAAIDAMTDEKWTALHQAANGGHVEVVKVLLDRGAAIDAMTDCKWTALHQAANGGHVEVVKVLLGRGAAIDAMTDQKRTALHWAARLNYVKVAKVLLDRGVSIDATDETGQTALHTACLDLRNNILQLGISRVELVKVLLARSTSTNNSIIDIADKSGDTALHCALRHSRERGEIVRLLLDNGADIDWKNVHGQTVVDIARELDWEHGVTLLTSTSTARARNPQIATLGL